MTASFTPTQTRILALLSDGRPHTRAEVRQCLADDLASLESVRPTISRLRRKLPEGQEIRCVFDGPTRCYQRIVRFTLTGE